MSRSTVHDKLSGRTPPRLGQVLTLVQACADYTKSIGAPLPADDTDEQVWREWTQAALARTPLPVPADVTASALPVPGDRDASPSPRWDLDPLIRAGMDNMVNLVQVGEREPMADWLPTLAEALREAGMWNEQFLLAASKEHAHRQCGRIAGEEGLLHPQGRYRWVQVRVSANSEESRCGSSCTPSTKKRMYSPITCAGPQGVRAQGFASAASLSRKW